MHMADAPDEIGADLADRLAAAERERDELRADFERFIGAISHDIRGPLQVQKGLISLLLGDREVARDERRRRFLTLIDSSADRLDAMVTSLVEWSRVNTRPGPLEIIDVPALRVALEFDLKETLQAADAVLEWGPLTATLFGDSRQLRRVLQLLVENAVLHHGPGRPAVRLSVVEHGQGWRLAVADDGRGIAPAMAERVFLPFQRLDQQVDSRSAGMGLTICRRIVERHGGCLTLAPAPGGGAEFSFTLPDASSWSPAPPEDAARQG